jgi:hypothetical protein
MRITVCNATVLAHEKGVLQNDVVCGWYCSGDVLTACDGEYDETCNGNGFCTYGGITLERGAILDLNGHDLTATYDTIPIYCDDGPGRCVVEGPGRIAGGSRGIYSWAKDVVVTSPSAPSSRRSRPAVG